MFVGVNYFELMMSVTNKLPSRRHERVNNLRFWLAGLFCWFVVNLASAQMLTNGGFESGLTNWNSYLSGGSSATFVDVATNVHSGTGALLVTVSNAGTASNSVQIVSSTFTAYNSDTYVLRFWASSPELYANLGINLIGAKPSFPQIPFELSTNPVASGTIGNYQEYLYAFRASGKMSIAFNFQTAGQYWLDDVEVLDLTNTDGFDVPMTYLWQWGQLNVSRTNSLDIGWGGGDNDKSCQLPDGSVAWIFNDSYASTLDSFYSNIRGNSSLPRNCIVHQIGTNLVWVNNGNNTLFVPSNLNDNLMPLAPNGLYWIGGSIAESNKLYVLLNGLNNSPLSNICMSVATLSLPALTLEGVVTNLTSPGTDNFGDFVRGDDGFYYIYNGAKVARVPVGQLAVDSAWSFWNGTNWVSDHNRSKSASASLPNFSGWSITRLGTSNYCAVFFPYLDFVDINAQFAPTPMGPWSSGVTVYTAEPQWGEIYYAPNICAGTGSNGVYTIGYSDNGSPENWFSKTAADKSWYNPHFIRVNLLQLSPYTLNSGNGGPGSRMSIKFAADQNYNHDLINNTYGAGVLNTTNWYNVSGNSGPSSGMTNVPYYTFNGLKYISGADMIYNVAGEKTHTVDASSKSNNVALLESWINVNNNCWYLSVTNLDPVFTNGYSVFFYFHGSSIGYGGQNYIRYYAGQTTNTTVLGTMQWNLFTTDPTNNGTFTQDLTPTNAGTDEETPEANYFVVTNLSGGAFDLLITNGNHGGVKAIEIVANVVWSASTLTTSATNAAYGTTVTMTNQVIPAPPDGERVTFWDGSAILGSGILSDGVATYTDNSFDVGSHSITAVYTGDDGYLASTSNVATVSIAVEPILSPAVATPSTNVYAGMNAVLLCSLYTGTQPYSFQWWTGGNGVVYTNVPGATNNRVAFTGVTTNNSGYYELVFTAGGLSVTSSVVQLTVNPPASINMQQAFGNMVLSWPVGVLLEATNVTGPWLTNNTPSPYTDQLNDPQMFYRVLVQ
jgi:hypothetical protein